MSEDQRPPGEPEPTRLGDFELLRELGRGGMGIVYEARQISLKRRVALKVLPPALGMSAQAKQRFEREAQAAAKLHHTNIVPVHAIGEHDGHHFYAMDLIDGQSLDHVLRDMVDEGSNPLMEATVTQTVTELRPQRAARSSQDQATTSLSDTVAGGREWFDTVAKLVADVADALHYAHGRGVIHRDIKPANLMLSREGHLSITDFGLARLLEEPGMTVSGSFLGTPAYMAPEQIAAGRINVDHRADIYSLGAVLYEMLTMQRPFGGQSREQVLAAVMTKDPPPPRRFNGKIPVDLETICLKALEKDVDRRYATAGEMAQDLRQYLQGGLIAARRAGIHRRAWKSIRRHPVTATATAVSIVAVAVIASLTLTLTSRTTTEAALRAVADADLMLERGDYSQGLERTEEALELVPGLAQARIVRARLLLQLRRDEEVIAEVQTVLAENPNDWTAHAILAFVGKKANRPAIPVEQHLAAVERLAPESADVYYLRGILEKSNTEAVELLTRALELDPAHTWAILERNIRYQTLRNVKAAMADAERMIAIRRQSGRGWRMLGGSYKQQWKFDDALAAYDRAVELDPNDFNNYQERGRLHAHFSRYEDAIADYDRAIELYPHPAIYRDRADIYNAIGRYDEAVADARKALEFNPDDRLAFRYLLSALLRLDRKKAVLQFIDEWRSRTEGWRDREARVWSYIDIADYLRRLREYDQALADATRAIEIDPGDFWGYRCRALVRRDMGDEAGFRHDCELIAETHAEEPQQLVSRGTTLGGTCQLWELALQDLNLVVERAPDWYRAYGSRGWLHVNTGNLEEALTDLDHAIKLAPDYPGAYSNRGAVYNELHRLEEALRDYEKRVELKPHDSVSHALRGTIRFRLGQLEEAVEDYDRACELNPLMARGYAQRAEALACLGKCDLAADDLAKAEVLAPQYWSVADVYGLLATAQVGCVFFRCADRYDATSALTYAREAAEAHPEVGKLSILGAALYRNGSHEEARQRLRKSVERSGGAARDFFFLAMSSWRLGERAQARSNYERAVAWMEKHTPNDPVGILLREEAAELMGIQP
jgi:serine/threonine protein kinase/predicted Zn-dependent protease